MNGHVKFSPRNADDPQNVNSKNSQHVDTKSKESRKKGRQSLLKLNVC